MLILMHCGCNKQYYQLPLWWALKKGLQIMMSDYIWCGYDIVCVNTGGLSLQEDDKKKKRKRRHREPYYYDAIDDDESESESESDSEPEPAPPGEEMSPVETGKEDELLPPGVEAEAPVVEENLLPPGQLL